MQQDGKRSMYPSAEGRMDHYSPVAGLVAEVFAHYSSRAREQPRIFELVGQVVSEVIGRGPVKAAFTGHKIIEALRVIFALKLLKKLTALFPCFIGPQYLVAHPEWDLGARSVGRADYDTILFDLLEPPHRTAKIKPVSEPAFEYKLLL